MSTSKSKIQLKWSSPHAESEGFVGVLNTRAEVKDQNDGKTGGVGVGHCNQEQTVRILRGLRFRGARESECWDFFHHGVPFYMLSKGTRVIHVLIAEFLIIR